ncbi:acetyltransferase [Shewanella waksmanii]|uniref:acetyltransferase n=1 Tax=Shewanella waksmanii TaxID=213783 RepID=UPI003735A17E
MKANAYIIGSGGHAKVVIDAIEAEGKYQIAGLIDDYREQGKTTLGYPVLGSLEPLLKELSRNSQRLNLFIAIGDNSQRKTISTKIVKNKINANFLTIIHPKAQVSPHATVEAGSIIMANAIIAPSAHIGQHAIVNHHSSIDHDCSLDNYSSLSPGTVLCGSVSIGECSAIGANATIIEKVNIGKHTIIGAGSTVINDFENNLVIVGSPAKIVSTRHTGQKYLK